MAIVRLHSKVGAMCRKTHRKDEDLIGELGKKKKKKKITLSTCRWYLMPDKIYLTSQYFTLFHV